MVNECPGPGGQLRGQRRLPGGGVGWLSFEVEYSDIKRGHRVFQAEGQHVSEVGARHRDAFG